MYRDPFWGTALRSLAHVVLAIGYENVNLALSLYEKVRHKAVMNEEQHTMRVFQQNASVKAHDAIILSLCKLEQRAAMESGERDKRLWI